MWPRQVVVPLEYSEGTRPQNPANAAARGKRRQSPTSLGERQRAEPGNAPVGAQAVHRVGERCPVVPTGQVGLDRGQLRVAGVQHRPVVRVGRGQGGLVEVLRQQPALVG
jgi:hypothetical protein